MVNDEVLSKYIFAIDQAANLDLDRMLSRSELGNMNFASMIRVAKDAQNAIRLLLAAIPEDISPELIKNVHERSNAFRETLQNAFYFDIRTHNLIDAHATLVHEINRTAIDLFDIASPLAAFFAAENRNIPGLAEKLNSQQATFTETIQSIKQKAEGERMALEGLRREAGAIIEQARSVAGQAGVGQFSTEFESHASAMEQAAGRWLLISAGSFTATLAVASITIYLSYSEGYTPIQIAQATTGKVLIVGLLATATFWCSRIYRSNKHQAAISRHRALALKTFLAFTKSASDSQTKDAVLLETTRSIFAHSNPGYFPDADGGGHDPARIIELFRSGASPSGPRP
jgi:hypothetical protein